jgi:methylmalonyl-CoA mutase C-terminal domain/subunit
MSILSGAHMTVFPRVLDLLREAGMDDVIVTGGGIIPTEDMDKLVGMGVDRLFGPGTDTRDIVEYLREAVAARRGG